jgi:hypothetical protein
VRRARTTTATGVLCTRYMCPRAVEAPGACAARSGCHKLRTVPGAALQRRPAGARSRRQRQPTGLRDARPRREPDGGHSATAPGAARPRGARWAPPAHRGRPDVSLAVGPRGAAGAARARPRRRQRARKACWRAFCCGKWGCARALTGVVCCCCALLRRAGFRNVADEQQRRQWGRDLPIILPVGARGVHRLNPFQQHGAMTGVGSGALAL